MSGAEHCPSKIDELGPDMVLEWQMIMIVSKLCLVVGLEILG